MNLMIHFPTFKSKWNSLKTWFTLPDLNKRRPSECSTVSNCSCTTTTHDSPVIAYLPLKRPSLADIKSLVFNKHQPEKESRIQMSVNQVMDLYHLALEELRYAQDSLGSPYYLGDRLAAKEAIENCQKAYDLLNEKSESLFLKISNLNTTLNTLPLVQEDQISL